MPYIGPFLILLNSIIGPYLCSSTVSSIPLVPVRGGVAIIKCTRRAAKLSLFEPGGFQTFAQMQVRQIGHQLSIQMLVRWSALELEPKCNSSWFRSTPSGLDSKISVHMCRPLQFLNMEPTCISNICAETGQPNRTPTVNSNDWSAAVPLTLAIQMVGQQRSCGLQQILRVP